MKTVLTVCVLLLALAALSVMAAKSSTIVVSDLRITSSDVASMDSLQDVHGIAPPATLSSPLEVGTNEFLMFSVHIKSQDSVKLDQAVIRFVDTQSGIGSFVEAKQNERDSSKYTFSLKNSPAVRRKAGLYGSVYEVELLAAGSSVSNPIRWAFGSVEFRGTVQRQEEKPKFQHPFPFPQKDATTKGWYDALPAIEHQFRPQAPRPHTAFAYMFTLASFGPLAVLVLGLLLLRPDFRLFPSGFDGLLALGFHGLIAVCVLAVFGFWISVPFFDLLKILSVLGVPMLFIGGRTLRAVAAKSEVA